MHDETIRRKMEKEGIMLSERALALLSKFLHPMYGGILKSHNIEADEMPFLRTLRALGIVGIHHTDFFVAQCWQDHLTGEGDEEIERWKTLGPANCLAMVTITSQSTLSHRRQGTIELLDCLREGRTAVAADLHPHPGNEAQLVAIEAQNSHLETACLELIDRIDAALGRISEGNFGTCTECGAIICPERLVFEPLAEVCRRCGNCIEEV